MPENISVVAFRDHTGEILDRVQGGQRFIIQRFSRPVAGLVPMADLERLEKPMTEDPTPTTERTSDEERLMALALSLAQGDRTEAARLAARVAADLLTGPSRSSAERG